MLEFPSGIKEGDIELIKLEPTFDNTKMIFDLINKNREYLGKWLYWLEKIQKPEDQFAHLNKVSKTDNAEFYIKYNSQIVGTVGFHRIEKSDKYGEIGYWLSKDYNGYGIMTRAIKIFENKIFGDLDFNRSEIRMDTENTKSEAVAKRLGYVKEGCLRQDFAFKDGKFRDTFIYSKLKSEWEKENA